MMKLSLESTKSPMILRELEKPIILEILDLIMSIVLNYVKLFLCALELQTVPLPFIKSLTKSHLISMLFPVIKCLVSWLFFFLETNSRVLKVIGTKMYSLASSFDFVYSEENIQLRTVWFVSKSKGIDDMMFAELNLSCLGFLSSSVSKKAFFKLFIQDYLVVWIAHYFTAWKSGYKNGIELAASIAAQTGMFG